MERSRLGTCPGRLEQELPLDLGVLKEIFILA